MEALLNYPTSLKKMAGVDISQKGLSRAAKVASYIHFHITVFIFVFLEYSGCMLSCTIPSLIQFFKTYNVGGVLPEQDRS